MTDEALEEAALRGRRLAYEEEEARRIATRMNTRDPRVKLIGYVVVLVAIVVSYLTIASAYDSSPTEAPLPILHR
jgi:hypothetical protein